ncbi:MAG TPA: choice-of-anchor Q domain-containing protein [Gammaproteobacteria bacterium]|nr:choice-of-anchor Q domain-containing protein [Gammaproteobacteria bacterium]
MLNTRLASNGGPTRTHALVAGSPAIDAINDGTCPPPARDQRGVKRPQDGNGDGGPACDSGSFERRPGTP